MRMHWSGGGGSGICCEIYTMNWDWSRRFCKSCTSKAFRSEAGVDCRRSQALNEQDVDLQPSERLDKIG